MRYPNVPDQALRTAVSAAARYFLFVFGAGFILGMVRVPLLVPHLGARVAELIERQKSGDLFAEETSELSNYLHIEHVMRLAKARARQRLVST